MKVHEARLGFAEQMSRLLAQGGISPMAGRILGWLLVAPSPVQSAEELAETLGASRGAISMGTRVLIEIGGLDRVRKPGDRRAYYRVKPDLWTELLEQNVKRMTQMQKLAETGLAVLEEGAEQRATLEEMARLYRYFGAELPRLIRAWDLSKHDQG